MSLINSFTHIQENWKFVIICVQNQWGVVHPWHGTVANLWGRHKDFTEFNENFEKSYLLNGLSNIVKFFTVWFLKIFCIKWIHIFFWVQCSFINDFIISPFVSWGCWSRSDFSSAWLSDSLRRHRTAWPASEHHGLRYSGLSWGFMRTIKNSNSVFIIVIIHTSKCISSRITCIEDICNAVNRTRRLCSQVRFAKTL